MSTVYKVVRRRRDGTLVSALVGTSILAAWRRFVLRYVPGETTQPKNGAKPLAFGSLKAARRFRETYSWEHPLHIWEAKAKVATPTPVLVDTWTGSPSQVAQFWARQNGRIPRMSAPAGTVACDSITLIKRVDGPE